MLLARPRVASTDQQVFAQVPVLLLEATERPRYRPRAVVDRATNYSGKKRLTRKNTLIADPTRYSHYLGPTTCGSTHDYQLLKQEFDVHLSLLDLFDWLADLGYLGLVADYDVPPPSLPQRKPRSSKKRPDTALTDAQQTENTAHARRCVKVEHAISGAKRLGCVAQTCRNKSASFNGRLLALACGIWNWHLVKQKKLFRNKSYS